MLRFGFVLALCMQGMLAYYMDSDLEAMDRLYSRGIPGTSTGGGGASECKKDLWIVWDNSRSVGNSAFVNQVRPFLKNLIKSPRLNVGPGGTHIGILSFSTETKTKVLVNMGEKQTQEELLAFLDSLKYSDVMGDGTRTGLALYKMNELLHQESPYNYRPDVSDVVVIFTDGEPVKRRWEVEPEFTPQADKLRYRGSAGELRLAGDNAAKLKSRDITIVGLAIGTPSQLASFGKYIEEWATSSKYFFKAEKDKLNTIMDQLISSSCIDPGQCSCDTVIVPDKYVAQGGKAMISWPEPTLKCASNRQPIVESKVVVPPVSPPAEFGVGQHTVKYIMTYRRGSRSVKQQCNVEASVQACECESEVRVNAQLQPGHTEAQVSWAVPKTNCPARLVSSSPSGYTSGRGSFPIGQHTVTYKYEHNGASGAFSVSCSVTIIVKGFRCAGIGFDPANQECCCGKVYDRRPNFECCGQNYIDARSETCDEYYTIIPRA